MFKRILSIGWCLPALLLACLPGFTAHAQALREYPEHRFGPRCAFDSVQDAAWRRNPAARLEYQAFLRQVREQVAANPAFLRAAPDVTVPVVMHIIHNGGTSNISDAQVNDAIRVINLDYSKTNADTSTVVAAFRPLIANIGFKFRLARKDPSGNCTTGITRTYSTDTNIGDDRVKSLIVWDQDRYLNVWICNNANGAGGYSILPCQGGPSDGIVIRNSQFGSIGTSCGANLCKRSLTHEIGHYFGLPHTWGGSNTPGLASNCGIDDGIADTPNTIGVTGGGCPTTMASCGNLNNVQNYMDYANCEQMFTLGQRAVMRASLLMTCRRTLISAANLVATGTNDGYVAGACAPVVVFRTSNTTICEQGTVSFQDFSYNADLTAPGTVYSWQFPGGVPATSNQRNPTVTYPTGGQYAVTLSISTAGGTGTRTIPQLVQVLGPASGLVAPVAESFESPNFPFNFPAPDPRNWVSTSTSNSGVARWARTGGSTVVTDGYACVVVRSPSLPTGTITWLTSPNINLSGFSAANPAVLQFDRAYARKAGVNTELLQVQFSTDCGVSWNAEASYYPAALNTLGSQIINGFVPDSLEQWQTTTLPIDPIYYGGRLQMRFELTSRLGNSFYLDHVRLARPTATLAGSFAAAGLRLFPNPYTTETALSVSLARPTLVQISMADVLGREVLALAPRNLGSGTHALPLAASGLQPGIYVVRVLLDGQLHTAKLVLRD